MSEGYPTAAQKEALRLICAHGRLDTDELGAHLVRARRSSSNPGFTPAIARMAGTLTWRLHAQGFLTETGGFWSATAAGRKLISCEPT
ncbi:hypothetical protein Aph01nite_36320 [Acrocarpospora phusangensis]|uniref:Uncharacterized protein n=1 Tax=Acrocarpospora phusangensis TaxID=1070424 RepID=A0A919UP66_9ACTN|nr:hypothetical protein [Acrocarpospora phusangensis]GIH25322.1 hypothetical protein Aph01nite_36320 [Acrocarpospora phusangensis]